MDDPVPGVKRVRVGQIGTKPDGFWLLCEDGYARKFEDGITILYVEVEHSDEKEMSNE